MVRQGNQTRTRTESPGDQNRAQNSLATQPNLASRTPPLNKEGMNEGIIVGKKDTTANMEGDGSPEGLC